MKKIDNPVRLAESAAKEYQARYGENMVSVTLYGSAAGGDFNPETSDINLLLVLKDTSLAELEKSADIQEKWMKKRFTRPLFMDPAYIARSLDSFPMEFLNMKGCYKVLAGEDVLGPVNIDPGHLRLQLERELKGKSLHLTQEWLNTGKKPKLVKMLMEISMRDFAAVFRALLFLKDAPIPKQRMELFSAVSKSYELEGEPFVRTLEACNAGDKAEMISVFPVYADAIRKLSEIIDK